MNRARLIICALGVCASLPAYAVDFRWTSGFAMGTSEASIRNKDGASLSIYCPSGQTDPTPGMFIKSKKVKSASKRNVDVQIIVDGKNYPFALMDTQFKAYGREGNVSLHNLVNALLLTRSGSFSVEYPQYNSVETFSLLNSREALGPQGGSGILGGCG